MLVLNFSHPLTQEHIKQIEAMTGQSVERVVEVKAQFDDGRSFAEQVRELVDSVGFSPEEWQTVPLIINPPSLNFIAITLLAELHGRMGYFPACIRLRPITGSSPPQFEVAEVINLQGVREGGRKAR